MKGRRWPSGDTEGLQGVHRGRPRVPPVPGVRGRGRDPRVVHIEAARDVPGRGSGRSGRRCRGAARRGARARGRSAWRPVAGGVSAGRSSGSPWRDGDEQADRRAGRVCDRGGRRPTVDALRGGFALAPAGDGSRVDLVGADVVRRPGRSAARDPPEPLAGRMRPPTGAVKATGSKNVKIKIPHQPNAPWYLALDGISVPGARTPAPPTCSLSAPVDKGRGRRYSQPGCRSGIASSG